MSGFTGMDVEQVRALALRMRSKADEIDATTAELTRALHGTSWLGPDRQRFETDWSSQYCTQLRCVADGLRDAAQRAEFNANEQEQASGSGYAGGGAISPLSFTGVVDDSRMVQPVPPANTESAATVQGVFDHPTGPGHM